MKARRYISGAAVLFIGLSSLFAQEVTTSITPGSIPMTSVFTPRNNVFISENIIPEKKPVPYSYIREADVPWSKTVWRAIDLRQRQNISLRYPIEGQMSAGDRYSLLGLLLEGIRTEEVTPYAYDPVSGWRDIFTKTTTYDNIVLDLEGDSVYDDDNNLLEVRPKTDGVLQFQVQEQWFFDKQHSVMNVRIIALAPVYYDFLDEFNQPLASPRTSIPFVVYFPQCRRLFATHAVYNPNNDAQMISYDDFFFQRRFASTIIAESNVFGNRMLSSYKVGQDILLESERIKNDLFIMEHDLWEY